MGAALASAVAADYLTGLERPANDEECCAALSAALTRSLAAVTAKAAELQTEVRELACTLVVVLAEPGRVAAAQIGDGAAVVGERDGSVRTLTIPQTGEYLNATTFLISPDAISAAQVRVESGAFPHLAVLTDGIEMLALAMPSGEAYGPFFAPLFAFANTDTDPDEARAQLESLLRSPRVQARTDDDLTLVLAVRKR